MLNTIIMTFVCIFAVYGALSFISVMVGWLLRRKKLSSKAHTVIFLKNDEDGAESYIRSIVWERALMGNFEGESIIAVDMDSHDDTIKILKHLEDEYANFHAMSREKYIKFIEEHQNGQCKGKNFGNN